MAIRRYHDQQLTQRETNEAEDKDERLARGETGDLLHIFCKIHIRSPAQS